MPVLLAGGRSDDEMVWGLHTGSGGSVRSSDYLIGMLSHTRQVDPLRCRNPIPKEPAILVGDLPTVATTADFKNGLVLVIDGQLWTITEFQHVKPGKGPAFVRTKLKNVLSGKVVDKTYNAGVKVDTATVDRRDTTYLYRDGSDFVFMDSQDYEQHPLPESLVGDAARFLLEGTAGAGGVPRRSAAVHRAAGDASNSRSPTPSRVCRATGPARAPSRPPWRPVRRSRCRCSSTPGTS